MSNNCLSVLYKHIIQVENRNVGLKVWGGGGGAQTYQSKKGRHMPPCPPPHASYASVLVFDPNIRILAR